MKSKLIFLFSIVVFMASCNSTKDIPRSSNQSNKNKMPDLVFAVDANNDGIYEKVEIAKENRPIPVQGGDQWIKDFYGSLKYPPKARNNGTQGIVILSVEIDQDGKVINVEVKNGVSQDIDAEAKRAYIDSTRKGYNPMLINNLPTKVLMELPVRFNIH